MMLRALFVIGVASAACTSNLPEAPESTLPLDEGADLDGDDILRGLRHVVEEDSYLLEVDVQWPDLGEGGGAYIYVQINEEPDYDVQDSWRWGLCQAGTFDEGGCELDDSGWSVGAPVEASLSGDPIWIRVPMHVTSEGATWTLWDDRNERDLTFDVESMFVRVRASTARRDIFGARLPVDVDALVAAAAEEGG